MALGTLIRSVVNDIFHNKLEKYINENPDFFSPQDFFLPYFFFF